MNVLMLRPSAMPLGFFQKCFGQIKNKKCIVSKNLFSGIGATSFLKRERKKSDKLWKKVKKALVKKTRRIIILLSFNSRCFCVLDIGGCKKTIFPHYIGKNTFCKFKDGAKFGKKKKQTQNKQGNTLFHLLF